MSNRLVALATIGAIISAIKWLKMFSAFKDKAALIQQLALSQVISVDQLYNLMASPLTYTGFVEGILDTFKQQYIPSKILPGIKLLYSKLILSTYNLRNSASVYRTTLFERMSSIFKLISPKTGKSIKVLETLMTNFGNSFEKLKSRTQKRSDYFSKSVNGSIIQLVIVFILQVFIAFNKFKNMLLFTSSSLLSWYHEQIYEQYYLPPGKNAVIYGTFIQKKDGLYTYKPQFIGRSKQALLQMLRNQVQVTKRLLVIFGIVLVPLIGWCCYKICRLLTNYLKDQKRMIKKDLQNIDKLEVSTFSCPTCHRNLRSIITKNCKHLTTCRNCIKQKSNICSECSKEYEEFVQLYIS